MNQSIPRQTLPTAKEIGWFQLVALGEFPIRDTRDGQVQELVLVVDQEAVARIAADFQDKQSRNPQYTLLIDFERDPCERPNQEGAAACWVRQLEGSANGVWALGCWTDWGAQAVLGREYRYLQPVWAGDQVEKLGAGRVKLIAITGARLSNRTFMGDPRLPIYNREARPAPCPSTKPFFVYVARAYSQARGLSVADAVTAVMREHPSLYDEYRKGQ